MNILPSAKRRQSGLVATLILVAVIGILASLTVINTSTVRRIRRERQLLDTRQQQHWRNLPVQLRAAAPNPPPSRPTPPAAPVQP
jgi:hypothetical protein